MKIPLVLCIFGFMHVHNLPQRITTPCLLTQTDHAPAAMHGSNFVLNP